MNLTGARVTTAVNGALLPAVATGAVLLPAHPLVAAGLGVATLAGVTTQAAATKFFVERAKYRAIIRRYDADMEAEAREVQEWHDQRVRDWLDAETAWKTAELNRERAAREAEYKRRLEAEIAENTDLSVREAARALRVKDGGWLGGGDTHPARIRRAEQVHKSAGPYSVSREIKGDPGPKAGPMPKPPSERLRVAPGATHPPGETLDEKLQYIVNNPLLYSDETIQQASKLLVQRRVISKPLSGAVMFPEFIDDAPETTTVEAWGVLEPVRRAVKYHS
ncbi:membrane protein [Rhodococcus phage MacGully]|nr:membrane protein [Rhodococcus phage MacGully]